MISKQSLQQENDRLKGEIESLRQRLLEADKLATIGTLASSITHEFNNILTTVINYAKLGLRNRQDEAREKAFDRILSASQRAAKITSGMLSYSRNRGERREATNLLELVQATLVLVEKDLQVHRISVSLVNAVDAYAEVNPPRIQQVLLNLMINARQAMQPGGSITIGVSELDDGDFVEISIKDTGSGIPADQLPHIFDQFFTTKTADAQGQGGTGLGLALCRQIIEQHQGRIRVESAVGRGTIFRLRLPKVSPPQLHSREAVDATPLPTAH